jgi:hypothetical protein
MKILKKPTGLVRFRFYKPKTEKTKPKKNGAKPEKTEPNRKNRAKLEKPSQTKKADSNRFELVFILKNQTEQKPVGLN